MALVCDIKSEEINKESLQANEDLEDGEIEDDGDDEEPTEGLETATKPPEQHHEFKSESKCKERDERDRSERSEKKRHEKKHLTEAEKSVMRLRKFEKLEREKREKFRRDQVIGPPLLEQEEDFATSLEKAIAKVLKKDKVVGPNSSDPEDSKDKNYDKCRDRDREDSREKEKDREKKGKKRKRKQKKNKQSKKNKSDSPKPDAEDYLMNQQIEDYYEACDVSPGSHRSDDESIESDYSERSDGSQRDKRSERRKKSKKKSSKIREREKMQQELRAKAGGKNVGVCLHYLQGLCVDENCQYSHESVQPMKLELCKFYLQECCAKGDKCLYMHEEFPCKYYHTGIPCPYLDDCKFAHGGPLSDGIKQVLFKHIETAPKELLGKFPRLSRENASVMIQQAQKALQIKYGKKVDNTEPTNFKSEASTFNFEPPSDLPQSDNEQKFEFNRKDNKRNRPSRWEDPEPLETSPLNDNSNMNFSNKSIFKDQDMRTSNGDIDMRTIQTTNIVNPNIFATKPIMPPQNLIQPNLLLPNLIAHTRPNVLVPGLLQSTSPLNVLSSAVGLINPNILAQNQVQNNHQVNQDMSSVDIEKYKMEAGLISNDFLDASKMDTDIRQFNKNSVTVQDNRHLNRSVQSTDEDEPENKLRSVMDEGDKTDKPKTDFESLPKTQRDLFKGVSEDEKSNYYNDDGDGNIDWYSDDEDDNRLTIKDDYDDIKHESDSKNIKSPPVKPMEVVEKLGDLSKIDISAEVSKLLTTIKQTSSLKQEDSPSRVSDSKDTVEVKEVKRGSETKKDPRLANDPRVARRSSNEERPLSIYEQGSLADSVKDVDLRSSDQDYRGSLGDSDLRKGIGRPDVDLRQLGLPFKGIQNYTPATEIDASINSHPVIQWRVYIVEIPKPDYTGLKLSPSDAQATGDPRLRKIFRLSVEEKDSPMSPKESPKASSTSTSARVDPRRKKMEVEPMKMQQELPGNMSYAQQLTMLQASPFYQSLTSNQKLLLNQELANRNDKSGQSDPTMSAMLQNLGLTTNVQHNPGNHMQALSILADVNNLGFRQIPNQGGPVLPNPPMRGPIPNVGNIGQGLLGPAPPLQNIPPDFPINFGGGLLGNAPPQFTNYQNDGNNYNNFNDDFYQDQGGPGPHFNGNNGGNNSRDNRGFRDRPRRGGRNSNNRNNNRNFFRKNKHEKF